MHRTPIFVALSVTGLLVDAALGSTFLVTNTADFGAGSLRQAMQDANANPGVDFIEFNIPGSGVQTIFPNSPLPVLGDTVSIDGSSQPGFAGTPLIELAGDSAGGLANGINISNSSSQIGWLTINGWDGHGISIGGSGNATVVGCFIGVNNDGLGVTYPNGGHGVRILGSPNNNIGGTTTALRNVIAGNESGGIIIDEPAATGNVVENNYVGVDRTGTVGLGNGTASGIVLRNCAGNRIGGAAAASRNVSAANGTNIILIDCNGGGNTVQGNRVGVNTTGTAALGGTDGIVVLRSPNTIVRDNQVAGNIFYNIDVATFSEGTVVKGNLVGTDATGMSALGGGGFSGISLFNVCAVTVGGTSAADRNVISGNEGNGVGLIGSSSFECTGALDIVTGNYIGVAADGVAPLGNGENGVRVSRPSGVVIGGPGSAANTIAHNVETGVLIVNSSFSGPPSHRVSIERNRIHDNGLLGIDLSADQSLPDGPTPNDPLDADTGANDFQNHPLITLAVTDGSTLTVQGSLNSNPFQSFAIDLFISPACDPSGYGEGQVPVASFGIATGSDGNAGFSFSPSASAPLNWFVTLVARNTATGDTSEFSPCAPISSAACAPDAGSCYLPNGTPGCAAGDGCCDLVCDIDPYCCDTEWDEICVNEATLICGECGTETSGDCFTPNGSPGCYDPECCATVCAADPYCCETEWDGFCSAAALTLCTPPCPGDVPFVSPGVVDVQDLLFVLAAWGESGPPRPRGDVAPPPTGDNLVSVIDLLEILANWGGCG